jgi:predicted outer membrane repeat protein
MINFIDNYSYQSGGGIFLDGCDMNLISNEEQPDSKSLFKNNTAFMGGAMRFFNLNNSFL